MVSEEVERYSFDEILFYILTITKIRLPLVWWPAKWLPESLFFLFFACVCLYNIYIYTYHLRVLSFLSDATFFINYKSYHITYSFR